MPDVMVVKEAQQEALPVVLSGFGRSFLWGPVTSLFAGLGVGSRLDEPPPQQTRPSPGQALLSPAACTAQPLNQPLTQCAQRSVREPSPHGNGCADPAPQGGDPALPCLDAKQPRGNSASCGSRERLRLGPPAWLSSPARCSGPGRRRRGQSPIPRRCRRCRAGRPAAGAHHSGAAGEGVVRGGRLGAAPTRPEREAPPARVVVPS